MARAAPLFYLTVSSLLVPSLSGLNRMRFEELVDHYRALAPFWHESRLLALHLGPQDQMGNVADPRYSSSFFLPVRAALLR
jgi:hypothetical protein